MKQIIGLGAPLQGNKNVYVHTLPRFARSVFFLSIYFHIAQLWLDILTDTQQSCSADDAFSSSVGSQKLGMLLFQYRSLVKLLDEDITNVSRFVRFQ